jgi:hypothetical protein
MSDEKLTSLNLPDCSSKHGQWELHICIIAVIIEAITVVQKMVDILSCHVLH